MSHTSELRLFPVGWSFIAAAESAATRAGDAVTDMAYFPAADQLPAQACRDAVYAADIYVLIAGFQYGSLVQDRPDVSYTELEFEIAGEAGIPRLIFLIGEETQGPAALFVDSAFGDRQLAFRSRLLNASLAVATITTPDKLETGLLHALTNVPRSGTTKRLTHRGEDSQPQPRSAAERRGTRRVQPLASTADGPTRPVVDIGAASSSLEQRLRNYYGHEACVVDGHVGADSEWVALDRDIGNITFGNLVPLSRRHRLRPAGHRSWQWAGGAEYRFSIDLTAENLLQQARKHFHRGLPALAFGCARLGECLSMRSAEDFEAQEDDGWGFLTQCMFYLPYRMDIELLEAVLGRVRIWLHRARACPRARRSSLLLSIANLYQDVGDWERSDHLYQTVLTNDLASMSKAATMRRRTIGNYFGSAGSRSVVEAFREIDDIGTPADFRLSVAIAKSWWSIENGQPGQALRFLEPFDFDEDAFSVVSDYSPHNSLELKLTQAAALSNLRLDYESQVRIVERIVQVMRDTRLRPVFTDRIAPVILAPRLNELITPLRSRMLATSSLLKAMEDTASDLINASVSDLPGRPTWVD